MSNSMPMPPNTKRFFFCLLRYRNEYFLLCHHKHRSLKSAWACVERRRNIDGDDKGRMIPLDHFTVRESWQKKCICTIHNIDHIFAAGMERSIPRHTFCIPLPPDSFIDDYWDGAETSIAEIMQQYDDYCSTRKRHIATPLSYAKPGKPKGKDA